MILRKNLKVSKSLQVTLYCRMCIKWYEFLKMFFPPLLGGFYGKKMRKFSTLGNLGNMKKECFFEKKKRFHHSKSFLHKSGKAQNMPVVAGPLVASFIKKFFASLWRNLLQ